MGSLAEERYFDGAFVEAGAITKQGDEITCFDTVMHTCHLADGIIADVNDRCCSLRVESRQQLIDHLGILEVTEDVDLDVVVVAAVAHRFEAAEVAAE